MRSGTSSPATSPTASSRAPRARLATSQQPPGSSRRFPAGSRIWPTCSPTTTPLPSSSPAPPGRAERASELEAPALRFLGLAAERALGLDTAAALASSEQALALAPAGHPDRAAALARFGGAAFHAGRFGRRRRGAGGGDRVLPGARRSAGRRPRHGHARGSALPARETRAGRPARRGRGPPRAAAAWPRARQRAHRARRADALQGRAEAGVRHAEQALALAGELGLPRPARTLGYLGFARCDLGDPAGLGGLRGTRSLWPPRPGRAARRP